VRFLARLPRWVGALEIHKIPLGEQPGAHAARTGYQIIHIFGGEEDEGRTMSENNQAPTPEEMGAKLDEEIKETVQDWADNPEATDFDDLDDRIDVKVRRTIAGWVGADEDADWKEVGVKMDANTRQAIAGWVGVEENADWPTITNRIENRIRLNIASLVHAQPPAEGAEAAAEASWADIGAKVESDVRSWVAGLVGTSEEADWRTISGKVTDKVKHTFDKLRHSDKPAPDADVRRAAQRIAIDSEETGDDTPPSTDPTE
jgi:hypothetical protein